ncbi:TPA: hypothetical protein MO350_002497 [Salmonella enterica subsp. enterica serovar Java]|nr:hypothetical protein [Salmonella enterica subsp. enterica serovar Java]
MTKSTLQALPEPVETTDTLDYLLRTGTQQLIASAVWRARSWSSPTRTVV